MSEEEKIARTPANENPWYLLATVYGEQAEGVEWHRFDRGLAEKNRIAWNRWMAPALSEDSKAELIAAGYAAFELSPFDETEHEQFLRVFAARAGYSVVHPPKPHGLISCRRVEFLRPVNFERFVFNSGAFFCDAAFTRDVTFSEAALSGDAVFDGASFSGVADFRKAGFDIAFLRRASFSSIATFEEAVFSYDGVFDRATFSGATVFRKSAFFRRTSFLGAELKSFTSFAGARFVTRAPDFRDARFSEITEWHGATWPPPPKDKNEAQQQVYAYEKLKAEMERLKKYADEQFFFAQELRARRALEPTFSLKWLLYYAYEQFGGYGQSVARPLLWLVLFWAVGSGLFSLFPAAAGRPLNHEDAARLSLVNLIPFLPYKPAEVVMKHLDDWVEWLGIFQAIIGAVLLFLFGLALRNLFRMK